MANPGLTALVGRLGIPVRDPDAIAQAFVHSSYYNENPGDLAGHNERLEFLGDTVVGLIVSDLLFRRFPTEDEGFLTARRAALVNREALAGLAVDLELNRHLLLGRGEAEGGGASRPSMLAATFEALVGAVYLSEGIEATAAWLEPIFAARLDQAGDASLKSAKSRLQEWSQRNRGLKPVYLLLETNGPPHDQRFTVAATLGGAHLAVGEGSSRQRAEEHAAVAALAVLTAGATEMRDELR
jgi:ribonuclease-3